MPYYRPDDVVIHPAPRKMRKGDHTNSAKYIGLSRNGKKWQVLLMIDGWRCYMTSKTSQIECAWIYDKLVIYMNGLAAKTNFAYTKSQVFAFIEEVDQAMTSN